MVLVNLMAFVKRFEDDKGEVYVEYVVLGSMATLLILAAVQYFFGGIVELFQGMGDLLRGLG